jgi:ABC-2 type transport system ATP-binding protein
MTDKEITSRIEELAHMLECTAYLDQHTQVLSGGYKQRFMIARSIIHRPKLVILDEPTVALDPHIRHQIWNIIRSMKAQEISVLLTTHYLDEAEVLSDRVCVLDSGLIRLIDTPQNLMSSFEKSKLEDVFLQLMQTGSDV